MITPIRDGMNVVPFEYLVAREAHKKLGAVLLSEFAGCARSLGGAVLVNPWDTRRFSTLLYRLFRRARRANARDARKATRRRRRRGSTDGGSRDEDNAVLSAAVARSAFSDDDDGEGGPGGRARNSPLVLSRLGGVGDVGDCGRSLCDAVGRVLVGCGREQPRT